MQKVQWERMFPDELEEAFCKCPLLYLSYGLCEPHGPQNALGLDGLKAHALACGAAQTSGGIVAPPYFWHIQELGGEAAWSAGYIGEVERSWMTALPPWMFFKTVCYHIRTADMLRFHGAIILTGHGGPLVEDLKRLVELVQPHVGTRLHALLDYEANKRGFDGEGRELGGGHAGKVETSTLWALEPDCVDMSRMPRDAAGSTFGMGPDAALSDRRTGERMVRDMVEQLGVEGEALLAAYDDAQPAHRLRMFEDVEILWEQVVKPELQSFRTMQTLWEGQEPVPASSIWYPNWVVPDRS